MSASGFGAQSKEDFVEMKAINDRPGAFGAMALLAMMLSAGGVQAAGSHEPPPPQGPPAVTVGDGFFPITIIRGLLEQEGDATIAEHNQSSPHKLSWASGARPTECGYDCVGAPFMSQTRHLNRPNEHVAKLFARLEFDLDIDNLPFDRRIVTNVTITARCNGWRDGSGRIRFSVDVDPPFVDDDHGIIEDILDFIFLPANLSRRIDDQIRARLGSGGGSDLNLPAECASLGVFSNVATGGSNNDAIEWDEPETSFGRPSLAFDTVTVRFASITRRAVPTALDGATPVMFDLFVNGVPRAVPQGEGLVLMPGETHVIDDVAVTIPADDLDTLQVIVADSLGGAGWQQFDADDGFGRGRRVLRTHRTELVPADQAGPGLPPLPGGSGLPTSNKPVPIDVHEFQINYVIQRRQQEVSQTRTSGRTGATLAR